MRKRYLWVSALALAIGALSQVETKAVYTNLNGTIITNGTIIVTTRAASDGHFFLQSSSTIDDMDDNQGPGYSPGDSAMCELLQDNGYATKLLPDKALSWFANPVTGGSPCLDVFGGNENPQLYYTGYCGPADTTENPQFQDLLSCMLVVISGSGSSSDAIQPNTNGIPIVVGENAVLGSGDSPPGGHGELFLYSNKTGNNYSGSNPTNGDLYMKVLLPNHPIMQGIPLVYAPNDTNNRTYVKIIRDPYPNENTHLLPPIANANGSGSHPNYDVSTTYVDINTSVPAPGLQIIGVLASHTNYAILAVIDRGGGLAITASDPANPWSALGITNAPARLAQFFVNEQGSHHSRRSFNALSVWGRILFVRCCQWAMEENLQPWQGLGIIDVGLVSPNNIKLSWTGSSKSNYRIYGASSLINPTWVPVVDSITNKGDGVTVTRTLNIASATQPAYLRLATLPEIAASWVSP